MKVRLDSSSTLASAERPARSWTAWMMTAGFLFYTMLILAGHLVGFPLSFAYLQKACEDGCALTPGNLIALKNAHIPLNTYINAFEVVQTIYVLVSVGIALLIVFKKPGQWVPLGLGAFLLGLSGYEGANYHALTVAYPALTIPSQLLVNIGMGPLGMYALLTFPNGRFGSRWIVGYYLFNVVEGVIALVCSSNPLVSAGDGVISLLNFPLILVLLIYRYHCLLNAKEKNALKWIIFSLSLFLIFIVLALIVIPAFAPADSLILVTLTFSGFFGCGINIAGFLMAVLYANAFDIDIFVRRTLVYLSLTAILVLLYAGLVLGSQFGLARLSPQAAQSPLLLVGSTLVVAALFQPLRHRFQQFVDRRFYRQKYDAGQVISGFGSRLHNETNLSQLSAQLVSVVQDTMQPSHISLWLRQPAPIQKPDDTDH